MRLDSRKPLLRTIRPAYIVLLAVISSLLAVSAFSQQQAGTYLLHPAVVPGGGGGSSNSNTRIDGSAGQHPAGASTGGSYTLEAGFWPNAEPCPFALSPLGEYLTQNGGPGSINVIATPSCSWTASTKDSWIFITSKESGVGNGVVTFEARDNFTGSARQTTINISGNDHIIVQDGGLGDDCSYNISPSFLALAARGGTGTVNVAAEERCAWQAVSTKSWITFTSINVGIGNGRVNYSVAANPGQTGRAGTIIIGGQVFAVKQKGS